MCVECAYLLAEKHSSYCVFSKGVPAEAALFKVKN
jgi:hypothetical protein